MNTDNLLKQAIAYAGLGWPVFPVHSWVGGCCTCGKPACDRPAKHPWCEHGFHDATTDLNQIKTWATTKPGCNWAIRTGQASRLLVLDVDADKGGDESLAELEKTHGLLAHTPTVRTGGGGRQFFLLYPAGSGLTVGKGIRPGLDYRGEGGYGVAPPSLHRSGRRYEWDVSLDTSVAKAPAWLIALLTKGKSSAPPATTPPQGQDGSDHASGSRRSHHQQGR